MRHSSIAVLTFSLCAAVVTVPGNGGAQSPGMQPRISLRSMAPLQLENQWTAALVNRDALTLDKVMATTVFYTENNDVMSRGDVIKSVNGSDKVTWARNEGMKLHDFGDVQVITGVLHLKGTGNKGVAFDKRYRFTDTWQKQSGRWRIIAAQDYLIP
jgi:ketosteroid isomerase-like protein